MTNGSTGLETRTPIAATMMRVPLSTNALLDRAGTYFPERGIVARLPDKSLVRASYAEVRDRARRLARALREDAGIGRGAHVEQRRAR